MLRVLDVPLSGQLVGLLALLAAALAVALTRDHGIAAAFAADPPRGDDEVDRRHAVIHPLGVMLDAPRVEQKAGLRRAPYLGGTDDHLRRHARDLSGVLR